MNEVERERRIVELLGRAVELEGPARRRYLDGACAGDARLRAELDEMLEEDQNQAGEFLAMQHSWIEKILPLNKFSPAATRYRYPSTNGRLFEPPNTRRRVLDIREHCRPGWLS